MIKGFLFYTSLLTPLNLIDCKAGTRLRGLKQRSKNDSSYDNQASGHKPKKEVLTMKALIFLTKILNKLPDSTIKVIGNLISLYLIKKYAVMDIIGIENLKERTGKPTLFISNHLSNIDGVILNQLLKENSISFMAGVKLGGNPLTSFFLRTVNHISINPNSPDKNAIKAAINHLKSSGSIMIFPEGTRSRTGSLIEAKKGFVLLAKMANVPIVPIALEGTEMLLPISNKDMGGEKLQKAHVKVKIGEPFTLPSKDESGCNEDWGRKCADYAMYQISKMLEPKYRGLYNSPGSEQ